MPAVSPWPSRPVCAHLVGWGFHLWVWRAVSCSQTTLPLGTRGAPDAHAPYTPSPPSMPVTLSSPLMELLRSRTRHDAFPTAILAGMQAAEGASAQSVEQLDTFLLRFFTFDLPKNFFIQMAFVSAWIALLILLGSIVILHRMSKRAFWIFKLQRRSEGTYIVPNALNTFLLFEGMFGIVWIAFAIVQYQGYWRKDGTMQNHIGVFNLIIWWPLWIGAFMAGWGSFYTAPGALDKGPLSSSMVGKFAPRPLIINGFCLGTPIILVISLIPPIVLTQTHLSSAFHAYRILHADMLSALASSSSQTINPALASQFLQRASEVWDTVTEAAWYMSIGYAIWPIWAGIFLLFYMPSGGYLCYMVWNQLRRQRAMLVDMEVKKREIEMQVRARDTSEGGEMAGMRDHSEALLFQPLTSSQQQQQEEGRVAPPLSGTTLPTTPRTAVNEVTDKDSGGEVFFPPLRPDIRRRAVKRISVTGTPRVRYNYLRRCFINLSALYIGIVLGAALYLGIAAALARSLYESYLDDPQVCSDLVYNTCLAAGWGALVFGSLTFFAILARFADPANTPDYERKKSSGKRFFTFCPRLTQSSQAQSDTLADGLQEKTRTLPAVPESVGATMDDPLQSSATLSSFKSKSRRGLKGGMKFNIQKKHGGLILRPEQDMSFGQPESASVSYHDETRTSTSRRAPRFVPQDMTQGSIMEEAQYRSYHHSTYGEMPQPAPLVSKPLAPERTPPLTPIRLDMPDEARYAAVEGPFSSAGPRRRHSEWEILPQHLPPPRRNSEHTLQRHRHLGQPQNQAVRGPHPPTTSWRQSPSPPTNTVHLHRRSSSLGPFLFTHIHPAC